MVKALTIVQIIPDPENQWLLQWVDMKNVRHEKQFIYFSDLSRWVEGELLADGHDEAEAA